VCVLYTLLKNIRLDLDDYNKRLKKAVITSMAGTWMSIVEGFGGMRVENSSNFLKIPKQWKGIPLKSILETRL
jgi:maltose phosphorylase